MPHLRSLHPLSAADIGAWAQLLIDCVEGGASVSLVHLAS
jgi:hypothetical protein